MIIYALISRADGTVFVESTVSGVEGNFPQVTRVVLDRLKDDEESLSGSLTQLPEGGRRTFSHDNTHNEHCGDLFPNMCMPTSVYDEIGTGNGRNYFHVMRQDGVIYLCLSDDPPGRRHKINFTFLEEIKSEFKSKYSAQKIRKANAYSMEKAFAPTLRITMHNYNTDPKAGMNEKILALTSQIDDLKNVLGKNIELVLKKDNDLQDLLAKADDLEGEAAVFSKRADKVKMKKKKENRRLVIYSVLAVLAFTYIVAIAKCGLSFGSCVNKRG
eukprot:CAMPEP_0172524056 /NCGR_PEP_ID=MMETSP1066-20121228/293985_1 /TAXON_ID=671091 /ORGANISM="Coscinodiscus wailesii, Strain CCMP2513" /LENGTH=271 /DNA_ID=CAMNT_0013307163 /DNA_START=34 /DNA_END=849 /DNA_ORIENTATION=+